MRGAELKGVEQGEVLAVASLKKVVVVIIWRIRLNIYASIFGDEAQYAKIAKAVLLDIGVGIDGGTVFYGNIGSDEHMANTVIGDKVNSASRLEGLTRVYHLPVIVSDYIKKEAESISKRYKFYEIDTVQVKGKTEGKKIYYPIDTFVQGSAALSEKFEIYEGGLKAYYKGDWSKARKMFKQADMEVCEVFLERMGRKSAPAKWSGIWTMTTK